MANGVSDDLAFDCRESLHPIIHQFAGETCESIPVVKRKGPDLATLSANIEDVLKGQSSFNGIGPDLAGGLKGLSGLEGGALLFAERFVHRLHFFPGQRIKPLLWSFH
jgi:hypothetical protein